MQNMIGGALLILIGMVLSVIPEKVFMSTEKWKYKDKNIEMSKTYKIVIRIVGIVLAVVGILVFFNILH